MWYIIQTITGKEQQLIEIINKKIPKQYYEKTFYINRECARKIDGHYQLCQELMFPGYIFVITKTPGDFFVELKNIPYFSKMLHDEEFNCYTVTESEQHFLESLIGNDPDHTVRMSIAQIDSDGKIISATNPLGQYLDKIVRQRLRKRYACIEEKMLGGTKRMMFGFWLEEDIEKEATIEE